MGVSGFHSRSALTGIGALPSGDLTALETLKEALGSDAKGIFTSPLTTTVIATGVGQWNDQALVGNLLQLTGADQPVLVTVDSRTWVQFGATDSLARATIGVGPNFDLMVRFRYSNANPHAVCLSFGGTNNDWAWYVENGNFVRPLRLNISAGANVTPTLALNTSAIIHFRGSGNGGWGAAWAGFVGKDALASVACALDFAEAPSLLIGPNQSGSLGVTLIRDILLADLTGTAGQITTKRQAMLDYLNAT